MYMVGVAEPSLGLVIELEACEDRLLKREHGRLVCCLCGNLGAGILRGICASEGSAEVS